ncbi:S-adenosyl-L-methionine-dependent methyltransferase [Coemansia reversa NRRL 1564]|uniref:tRNA (adenine(58)-N(1))-methyltransferase catalytic subunit TRM61 n=1 Tax=Coemansia reversa (strain ATCC 12441 / NRRL 1564) TaxID=763665 RepID=A0A2G5B2W7_COERN|nr:S-adenosyl-L-methionine-dependent methyltransferase [Coemansia reversa NRRL 1564]|eukprot:PIA13360.1 S-adenosyl-L-methionine-dependent methyltransferase [Coemansia reversa NRRL 1564]
MLRQCKRSHKQILVGPLQVDKSYETHKGVLYHKNIIGRQPRDRLYSMTREGNGAEYVLHTPTLEEYVLLCKRQCTPIYPKDASAIISMLDINPGDRILEAGTGNAALTMHLARAVGISGKVHTVENIVGRSKHAKEIVQHYRRGLLLPSISFHIGLLSNRKGGNLIAPLFDGLVLDMPTPWTQLPFVFAYLKPDRYAVCYLPNMSQVLDLVRACQRWPLILEDVVEVTWRSWELRMAVIRNQDTSQSNGDAMVCHPTHTPIGHTAFLVKLRKSSTAAIK